MIFRNRDKDLLLNNTAVRSRLTLIDSNIVLDEDTNITNWVLEDFRYVPNQGFIGQFVERLLDGELQNIPEDLVLENKIVKLEIGVVDNSLPSPDNVTYYDYGNFMITSVNATDTTGDVTFEACDFTKYFNKTYADTLTYPCSVLELANDACMQANVPLASDKDCWLYSIPETLDAGTYKFKKSDDEYIEFTTTKNLKLRDSIMYVDGEQYVIQKTITDDFKIIRETLVVNITSDDTGNILEFNQTPYVDFVNNDFVIEGNHFDGDTTCRNVMKAIGKLAYSWVRVGADNRTHIDFSIKQIDDIDDYNKINTDEYYESSTADMYFGPVNKVLIGLSAVDGENVVKFSDDFTEETECVIQIFDNELTYTQELRQIAINGCERLFGLTYLPTTIDTIGLIWLEGDDYVKLTNVDNKVSYTYPFNRTIDYKGYITSSFSSDANSTIEREYEYDSETLKIVKKTTLDVNKMDGEIKAVASEAENATISATEAKETARGFEFRISQVEDRTSDLEDEDENINSRLVAISQNVYSIQNLFQITGGSNLIKNSAFRLKDEVWNFDELVEGDSYHTQLGQGFNSLLIGQAISAAEIKLKNVRVSSNTEKNNVQIKILNTEHSFTYSYKLDEGATGTIKLINMDTSDVVYQEELTPTNRITRKQFPRQTSGDEESETFITSTTNYKIEIETSSTYSDRYLYIYDLMMNSGDITTWEPASGELSSTNVKMSEEGIEVISSDSNIATLMSSGVFGVYPIDSSGDISGDAITEFDDKGLKTGSARTDEVYVSDYIHTTIMFGNEKHYIEYFRGD